MKTKMMKRILGFLLSAVVLFSAFACFGCVKKGGEDVPNGTPVTIVSEGASDYVILYPQGADATIVRVAEQLRDAIKDKTGVTLQVLSVEKQRETDKEILIGEMEQRQVTLDVGKNVRSDDYTVKVVGSRVVIVGGNDTRTVSAVRKFVNEAVNTATGNTLTVQTGEFARLDGTYSVTELTFGGVDVSEFQIVYSAFREDFYRSSVEELQTRVRLLCGVRLKAVPSSAPAAEHEFLFGDCGRELSKGLTAADGQYSLSCDGKSVALAAYNSLASKWSVRNLLDEHLSLSSSGKLEVSLPVETVSRKAEIGKKLIDGADLRIMSSNVLFLNQNDGTTRAKLLKDIYMEYYPDVIGLQECDSGGHSLVVSGLSSYYSAACATVGTSSTKSHTPILYRADSCKLLNSGSYLFARQADGSKTKILSWAVFKHLATDKTFAVINVHCAIVTASIQEQYERQGKQVHSNDVEGAAWREDNSREILERFDQLKTAYGANLPVFIMGDMNATANAESIQMLDRRAELGNCIDLATVSKTTGKRSWHDLGKAPPAGNSIDHMFVTKDTVQVYTHYLNATPDALKSSDHCQLICEVAWK
ncbi:MAG: endonuclease/exonuclease/phosphatase family protein [Clostridia bacterium]|nr:endonuclease/exonuclease/phosphatase family protein [Clostridia bacterium]